jgi:3-oxoacyl-[acyl-carrier-protein] synthase II
MPTPAARRVVITGMGAISSIGVGLVDFTAGLRAGRNGAKPVTAFDTTGFPSAIACEVGDFQPQEWIRNVPLDRLGRASRFATAAARMAVHDAGLDAARLRAMRGLVTVGTTDGESQDTDGLVASILADGPEALDPVVTGRVSAQSLALGITRELGLTDVDTYVIGTACSSGNFAIGDGLDAIRHGEVDFALCGGADALCRRTFAAFHRLGLVAPDLCRPFDTDRKGILTSEGAGVLLLESLDSALERETPIYAEVLGYGLNCDARHPVSPTRSSVAHCMRLALRDSGVEPHEVDLVSAHGTGTKLNDITESGAVRDVFGDSPPRTVALKSMLGHSMGASSALAAVACSLAIANGFIPPTVNHRDTDPECPIDCVPNHSVDADLRVVQNNGFAFGGDNAVLLLGKYERTSS